MSKFKWLFVKPINSLDEINRVEKNEGFNFPKDFKSVVEESNGGCLELSTYDTKNNEGYVFNSLLSFNPNDLDTIQKTISTLKKDLFIPIANDGFGNYIAYKKSDSKLYFLNHETDGEEFIANSFSEFLKMLY